MFHLAPCLAVAGGFLLGAQLCFAQQCIPPRLSLVSWWRGEGNASDAWGTNNGTLLGGATFGAGAVGQAFQFDGSGNAVCIAASPSLDVGQGTGLTIEAWIQPTSVTIGRPIVEWVVTNTFGVLFMTWNAGAVHANIVGTDGSYHMLESAPGLLVPNQFHHVAVTYDKVSGVARLLVNGVVVKEANFGSFSPRTSSDMMIGYRPVTSPYGPLQFFGLIDEVSLYNRGLTTNEIQAIYQAGSAGKCIEPVAPFITVQPTNRLVTAGETAAFWVSADGTQPLSYQWRFNGTNLAGATTPALTLTNVHWANAGIYTLLITNVAGALTSNPALLDVRCSLTYGNGELLTNVQHTFSGLVQLELWSAFPNANSFYTLDGSAPSFLSTYYAEPFALRKSAILRTITYSADFSASWEATPIQLTILPAYDITAITRGGGSVILNPPTGPYGSNSTVTATATASNGWTFLRWMGDASGTNPVVQMTVNRLLHLEAQFGTTVGTTVTGNGAVQLYPAGTFHPYGSVVRLTAIPQAGHCFGVWGNAGSGTVNPLYFPVTNPAPTVSSLFVSLHAGQHTLTAIPDGFGQVTLNPRANVYTNGASVTLAAIPEPGQTFLGWAGDVTGVQNPLVVNMTASLVVWGTFTRNPVLRLDSPPEWIGVEGCRLTLNGEFGVPYRIDASTNLTDWMPLLILTNTFGQAQLTDPAATNTSHRFYRALEIP
jgi:hypothetical protein